MSVTTWTRIEPESQMNDSSVDLAEGVAARLADPLWMLGRQYQMGELTGEDAASPVTAQIAASTYAIDSFNFGPRLVYFKLASVATESEVEQDAGKADPRTLASAGASLMDRLAEANV